MRGSAGRRESRSRDPGTVRMAANESLISTHIRTHYSFSYRVSSDPPRLLTSGWRGLEPALAFLLHNINPLRALACLLYLIKDRRYCTIFHVARLLEPSAIYSPSLFIWSFLACCFCCFLIGGAPLQTLLLSSFHQAGQPRPFPPYIYCYTFYPITHPDPTREFLIFIPSFAILLVILPDR